MVATRSDPGMFNTKPSAGNDAILLGGLLAVVVADMPCVLRFRRREIYEGRLESLCAELRVEYDDVVAMIVPIRAIERIVEGGLARRPAM